GACRANFCISLDAGLVEAGLWVATNDSRHRTLPLSCTLDSVYKSRNLDPFRSWTGSIPKLPAVFIWLCAGCRGRIISDVRYSWIGGTTRDIRGGISGRHNHDVYRVGGAGRRGEIQKSRASSLGVDLLGTGRTLLQL